MNKSLENPSSTIVIDLRGVYNCPKLYARKVWEALYRAVNAGTMFLSFDNFLIDYEVFHRRFDNALTDYFKYGTKTCVFYWAYCENGYYTKIYNDDYPECGICEPFYKITFDIANEKITLEPHCQESV